MDSPAITLAALSLWPKGETMIARQAADTLRRLEKGFPVLCVTGSRQSGKTTLARSTSPDKSYLSLEDPDIARLVENKPLHEKMKSTFELPCTKALAEPE